MNEFDAFLNQLVWKNRFGWLLQTIIQAAVYGAALWVVLWLSY